jgi:hypothetical protein
LKKELFQEKEINVNRRYFQRQSGQAIISCFVIVLIKSFPEKGIGNEVQYPKDQVNKQDSAGEFDKMHAENYRRNSRQI